MKKNSFLGLFGISVACAMLVGGARAVEYPYEMFSFFVPDASDGCSPIIGTKDTNGCYTITPQTLVDGQCTPTTPVQNVCDGAKGDKGDNAPTPTFAIDGENLKMTVDGTTTTLGKVTGNDGVSACAPLVTKETGTGSNMGCTRTNIQKQKMVNGSCADDGSIANGDWVCNGSNANVTSDTVKSALGLASNAIVATTTDIPDVSGFQTAQNVKDSIAEETTKAKLQATLGDAYISQIPADVVTTTSLKADIENSGALNNYADTATVSALSTKVTAAEAAIQNKLDTANLGTEVDKLGYVTSSDIATEVNAAISSNNNILQGKDNQSLDEVIAAKVAAALDAAASTCSTDQDTVTCTSDLATAFQTLAGSSGVTTKATNK